MTQLDPKPSFALFESIAHKELNIPVLTSRGRDSLDFHEVGVTSVERALTVAYRLGQEHVASSSLLAERLPLARSTRERLALVAKEHLHIPTLAVRHSDSLDFHDVSVDSVRSALQQAYLLGRLSRSPAQALEAA